MALLHWAHTRRNNLPSSIRSSGSRRDSRSSYEATRKECGGEPKSPRSLTMPNPMRDAASKSAEEGWGVGTTNPALVARAGEPGELHAASVQVPSWPAPTLSLEVLTSML